MAENWYDGETIARVFLMPPADLEALAKDGIIASEKRKDARYYDLVPALQSYITYLREKEDNMTAADVAALFGLSARRITQITSDGVLVTYPKKHGAGNGRVYRLREVCTNLYQNLSAKAAGKDAKDATAKLEQKKLEAEVRLKESQGELHRLRTDIQMGKYIAVDEVKLDYAKFFTILKRHMLAIPARVAGIVAPFVEPVIARSLESELRADLTEVIRNFIVAAKPASQPEQDPGRRAAEAGDEP